MVAVRLPLMRLSPSLNGNHSPAFLQALTLPELARMVLAEGHGGNARLFAERILEAEDDYRFERDSELHAIEQECSRLGCEVTDLEASLQAKDERIRELEQELADERDEVARLHGQIKVMRDDRGEPV